ncbi:30S ribosome-binding factor RbfA [Dehalococcoidia bacterium]|nr:30S ribosome-binding factor RbfA [Dehalococcoidia bacterium]
MSRRQKRINHAIRREISDLLFRQVNDPRIKGFISVTEVDVSPDLTQARVSVSVMGSEEEKAGIFEGLAAASGFLRRELGARLRLRYIPKLIFERDDNIERGERLLHLIEQISDE